MFAECVVRSSCTVVVRWSLASCSLVARWMFAYGVLPVFLRVALVCLWFDCAAGTTIDVGVQVGLVVASVFLGLLCSCAFFVLGVLG